MDKHCGTVIQQSTISNKNQRIPDKQRAWVSKTSISRRSRTQTNIYFMTPSICGVRKGNRDLVIVRTVLPMGGGVWSEESTGDLPRWQPFFYILMEVAVTGVSALTKLGVVYLSSMHLLVGPFDLSKTIPLCGTSEPTSYRGWSVFSYWFSNKEVTDDHLFGETQRKLRRRQREPQFSWWSQELEKWSRHSTEGLAFTCWSVLAINI